ncbi:hypothetical protein ACSW9V_15405 (plasmid) [Clostridium perfringens]|uniref:hypothetical protein n=1 Tax=Clostridium perfringens TaxID=1502 RepID=UPI000B36BE7F|nr:hypothetical protein [Clostridium perfringens]EGT0690316.1 hypothetical protein [Clostridium perfringens]EGT0693477.1 hypothetical protein [Clostridium perfringens]EGT0696442.1 hypothetical protein [Clostridium perfringens]MDU3376271.1 hypothetical protein [Clostridium perfringens]MDU3534227.1 hypothetical protein [Clostridium perfringens]
MNKMALLENLKNLASEFLKWDKNNGLGEKAIFLCKESGHYIYLVENKKNPFYGVYTRDGFKRLEEFNINFSNKNYVIIKETIIKNITYRLDLLDKRRSSLVECSLKLMAV